MEKKWADLFCAGSQAVIFFILLLASPAYSFSEDDKTLFGADPVQAAIQSRLLYGAASGALSCQGEAMCSVQLMPSIYEKRQYQPLWSDGVQVSAQAMSFVRAMEQAPEEGLVPADYYLSTIDKLLFVIQGRQAAGHSVPSMVWAELDLILTDAFLLYGSHLSAGRVNPETLHNDWKVNLQSVDLVAALERATAPDSDVDAEIDALRPPYPEYRGLKKELARLRNVVHSQEEVPRVPDGTTLRPGDRNSAIPILRQRLIVSGDLSPDTSVAQADLFDGELVKAVKAFQQRNGLATDGAVGKNTFYMLNIPVQDRIRQVIINLERWRWLPRDLGRRHVVVNTADFNLKAVANNTVMLDMRVVVGRPARRSPVFSAEISYLVVNPYWNIPNTIAVADILPRLKKGDVSYLNSRKIRVFQTWSKDAVEINPSTIDWRAYGPGRFPFRLRQDPGPTNSLGRIKFMFPNPFAVYLHDTPNHALFDRTQRDFSSGCIRVEFPSKLAEFVLAETPDWPPEKLAQAIKSQKTQTIRPRLPVPVHLLYITAWTDDAGVLQFRKDIYDRDIALQRAFNQRRSQSASHPSAFPVTTEIENQE
ncbi:L,D-transpeptidase family protein [Desulfosarcina sp. OttesenSCG-928-A07]|nr:L,D-transpeptidase family protein [Desulfosarcina sp. OttesenSCG-928-G17]MDL2328410.1 L,D-transpeptidase family protein [Desulfosarcina sp. OttesenSCG-928-A07]